MCSIEHGCRFSASVLDTNHYLSPSTQVGLEIKVKVGMQLAVEEKDKFMLFMNYV